jgi:hypothetical protein
LALSADVTNLSSISVSGTTSLGGNVTTTGSQTYTGATTLISADRVLTSSSSDFLSLGTVNGLYGLTLSNGSGAITLGSIGNSDALTFLTLQGTGTNSLNGDIKTSGNIDLKGTSRTTTFDLDRAITTTMNGANGVITLGTTNAAYGLTLNSGSGTINLSGVGVAGDGMLPTSLAWLILTGTGINHLGGSITSFGQVNLKGTSRVTNVALSQAIASGASDLTMGNVNLSNGVTLTLGVAGVSNISMDSITGPGSGSANVTFSNNASRASDGINYVSNTGTVTVNGSIGTNIGTLWLNKFTGDVSFNGSVQISQLRMDANAVYNLSFIGSTNNIADFSTTTPFNTTGNLTLGSSASSTFTIGGKAFNLLTPTDGGPTSVTLAGTFTTSLATAGAGSITLGGSGVTLLMAADVSLNSTASNGNITINSAINGLVSGANKALTLNAGTGSISVTDALSNMGNLNFTGNEIIWSTAIGGVGSFTLQTTTNSRVINLLGASDAGASTFDITKAQFDLLGTNFTLITVGNGT